mgnify:CR=1 FL=1
MKAQLRYGVLAAAILAISACGGRKANPVAETQALDTALSCDHVAAEIEVNTARLSDLVGEGHAKERRNLGMIFVSPLFLDLSNSEQTEAKALEARNRHLESELERRNCPA